MEDFRAGFRAPTVRRDKINCWNCLKRNFVSQPNWLRVSELAGLREQERAGDDLGLPLRRVDFVVRLFGNGNSIIPK